LELATKEHKEHKDGKQRQAHGFEPCLSCSLCSFVANIHQLRLSDEVWPLRENNTVAR